MFVLVHVLESLADVFCVIHEDFDALRRVQELVPVEHLVVAGELVCQIFDYCCLVVVHSALAHLYFEFMRDLVHGD